LPSRPAENIFHDFHFDERGGLADFLRFWRFERHQADIPALLTRSLPVLDISLSVDLPFSSMIDRKVESRMPNRPAQHKMKFLSYGHISQHCDIALMNRSDKTHGNGLKQKRGLTNHSSGRLIAAADFRR